MVCLGDDAEVSASCMDLDEHELTVAEAAPPRDRPARFHNPPFLLLGF